MSALGRRPPTDWAHVERFPLTELGAAQPKRVPVAIGVNWYVEFDQPERDGQGNYWIARGGAKTLTSVRGGHCVCLEPASLRDSDAWWAFYDQGDEGACVGFGCTRMMSLLNRKRYDAAWLYHEAQKHDEYPDTPPAEGTSVRAGLSVLRNEGHRAIRSGSDLPVKASEGIAAYRWATKVGDVLDALGTPDLEYVTVLNSWGKSYPHRVRMPLDVLLRLMREDGEVGVVTDR